MNAASRPKVLVCDDEVQILRALRVILRDAGFEPLPASTAEEALDVAAVARPDAGIIDLVLPDGDGVEVCRRLREWTEIPLIVLSAVGDEDAKVRALAAGADDYITKPFGPRELVARLNANLRRVRNEPESTVISSDGLDVDLARRTVRLNGDEVHLTPTEFDLAAVDHESRSALDASQPARVCVGPGLCRRHAGAAGAYRKPASQDRAAGRPALHPHRPGRRLPLRGLAWSCLCAARAAFTTSLWRARESRYGVQAG
jgi:two-component system KDP operon response regulator KdpE